MFVFFFLRYDNNKKTWRIMIPFCIFFPSSFIHSLYKKRTINRERERENMQRQLPPAEISKGKNESQWSVSEQRKERVGLSSFVNTTTDFFSSLLRLRIDWFNLELKTKSIFFSGNIYFRFSSDWLRRKRGDLLPFGSTHVWTCFKRLYLISGWNFFFFFMYTNFSCVRDLFFFY